LLNTSAGKESTVLRVTTRINSGKTCLVVEGRLAGACVGELERCWRSTASKESAESIFVDLSSVTSVDMAGKQLLRDMHEQGIRFTAAGLLAKCLIEELECSTRLEKQRGLERTDESYS
jgi:ABC-type transporter Mla MlaB component